MLAFDRDQQLLVGPHGSLRVSNDDAITRKLARLIEGACGTLGPRQAAAPFGFSTPRYSPMRQAFRRHGATALVSKKRGPKRPYRRPQEVTRQVIRHRCLDPDATAEVMAQKIRPTRLKISTRRVERVIEDFGLQKKPAPLSSAPCTARRNPSHHKADTTSPLRPNEPRTRRTTAPRRQGAWDHGRTLAPCPRTLTVRDLGSLVRLDWSPHTPAGATRGAPLGPRGGAVRSRCTPATHPEPQRLCMAQWTACGRER